MSARKLLDDEGENRAVRCFLRAYAGGIKTVTEVREHLRMSGYPYWPDWVEQMQGHLSKADAQLWLRHLFALETEEMEKVK